MSYLVWRQHHRQFAFAAAALAVLAAVLLPSGVHLADAYRASSGCFASGGCGGLLNNYGVLLDVIGLTAVVPALFGLFWGAPVLAAEFEAGTLQLAWTQSVTRRRWLAVKLGWLLAGAAVWAAAITALVTWWSGPLNDIYQYRFNLGHFDTEGLVPVAYSVFAVALGVTVGLLVRRTLPALAVTLGVFTVVRFAIDYLARPHYLAPVARAVPLNSAGQFATGSYWSINTQVVDSLGRVHDGFSSAVVPAACRALGASGRGGVVNCLSAHGWRMLFTYQPADRFWTFQGIETGIYLALAAGLLVVALVVVNRRDG